MKKPHSYINTHTSIYITLHVDLNERILKYRLSQVKGYKKLKYKLHFELPIASHFHSSICLFEDGTHLGLG
jgi:hypothetical protein